MIAGY